MMTLNHAWDSLLTLTLQSTLLCLFAGAGLLLLKKSAASGRHLLLALCTGALLAAPLLALFLPHWKLPLYTQASAPSALAGERATASRRDVENPFTGEAYPPRSETSASASTFLRSMPSAHSQESLSALSGQIPLSAAATASSARETHRITIPLWQTARCRQAVVAVWLLGCAIALLRLLSGLIGARRVTTRETVADPNLSQMVTQLQAELGMGRTVTVRQTRADSALPVPLTWGHFRPTLLLPPQFAEWPQERRRMVVLHELAHVQRADWLVQVLVQITCALYWFHPLVWWTAHRLQAESERACDDTVLLTGVTPAAYAENLVEVIRTMNRSKKSPLSMLGMAHPPIEARLRAILAPLPRRRPTRSLALLASVGALVCAVGLASLQVSARPALAKHRPDPIQAATGSSAAKEEARRKAADQYAAAANATVERWNAQTRQARAQDETTLLKRKLEMLEERLSRNQQENAELRQRLNALEAQTRKSAGTKRTLSAQERRKAEVDQVRENYVQQEALKRMLKDLEVQTQVLQARIRQAGAAYESGAKTIQEARDLKAELEANRMSIALVQDQLRAMQAGQKISFKEQQGTLLRMRLVDLYARLQQEQDRLTVVKARAQAGLAVGSDQAEAEANVNFIKIEIEKLVIQLSARP